MGGVLLITGVVVVDGGRGAGGGGGEDLDGGGGPIELWGVDGGVGRGVGRGMVDGGGYRALVQLKLDGFGKEVEVRPIGGRWVGGLGRSRRDK